MTTCSSLSRQYAEPIAGTAATAVSWLCLEQPGPWGRDALVDSHLDRQLADELASRAAGTGVRIELIRRPGRHADTAPDGPRRCYLASTRPGAAWLEQVDIEDPKELLDLDFLALGTGIPAGVGELLSSPVLLVCTNGKRDRCCAELGRPIVAEMATLHPDDVWECTHTGGHRFAPTGLVLPTGYTYGRLDLTSAQELMVEARLGRVYTGGCRGRSTWSKEGQVAELAVRELTGERDPDALTVRPSPDAADDGTQLVAHTNGRTWQVDVRLADLSPARPTSCDAAPVTPAACVATNVIAVA